MRNFTFKLMAAFIAITAVTAVSGCTSTSEDIDLSLFGGEALTEKDSATVDIRQDSEETEPSTLEVENKEPEDVVETIEPAVPQVTTTTTSTTPEPETTKPAVTITTDKPKETTPAQTVRTDLPKVTAEPQYTTAATTTTKPAQTEPTEIKTDANGFPADPQNGDIFTDSTGQGYMYDTIFGWIKHSGNGETIMQEFPEFELSGEKILH